MSQDVKKFLPPTEQEVKFVAQQEPWTIYQMEDGSIVRVRPILVKAIKTGKVLENGKPELQLKWQQVMDVEWPSAGA